MCRCCRFQVFRSQARQDGFVDSVLTESLLILFEAKAPQPTGKVHDEVLIPSQASFGQLALRDGRPTESIFQKYSKYREKPTLNIEKMKPMGLFRFSCPGCVSARFLLG